MQLFSTTRPAAVCLAFAATSVAGTLAAQEGVLLPPEPEVAEAAPPLTDAELLGDLLVVDGVTVSQDAIKRQVILGNQGGRTLYELAKLRIFINREMKRQIAEDGKTLEDFAVADEEIQKAIQDARDQVDAQFEGQDVELEDVYPEIQSAAWLDNLRLTKLFRKVYLPENPNDYPAISVTAITSGENGEMLYKALIDQWNNAQALKEAEESSAGPEAPGGGQGQDAGQQFMDMLLQQTLVGYLNTTSDIQEAEDGVADHLLATVDGEEITVDSIWQIVRDDFAPVDVWRAKKWFVNVMAAEKALKEAEALLDSEITEARYEEYAAPYEKSFLSIPKIATVIKKFPTLGNYKTYYRLQESFRDHQGHLMTDEALKAQGDRKTSYLVSQATLDADVILLSAYDFQNKRWKKDGWAEAERKAVEVARKLAEGGDWNQLLDQYSEFWDQPVPTASQGSPDVKLKNKGRFRGLTRNDLLRMLEESDFSIFLKGDSITDLMFFEQAVGTIENPRRGPYGWYIPRLIRKTPPTMSLSPTDTDHREFLSQDWISDNLNAFVHEAVSKATVTGIDL